MGDPAGIGAEIIVKALTNHEICELCRPLVIGDTARLRQVAGILRLPIKIKSISSAAEAAYQPNQIDCLDLALVQPDLPFGAVSAVAGEAAFRYVEYAAALALAGAIDAICTAPLSKEAMHAAGHRFPGHTELLAHLTGTPHASENGLFGRGEEEQKIFPAVQNCRKRGLNVAGPFPADTLFFRAGRGDFDLVVAMYRDQGHGPIKVLGLDEGVNITLGLPIVRTSVDHGTAFDIAGSGKADERSLLAAIRYAVELAPRRS
jgi:4-hydroxy-L-threonine phosphate dehydrogenase PdxA